MALDTRVRRILFPFGLASAIAVPTAAHADSWAYSNTNTITETYTYSNVVTNTNTETNTWTNTNTCTENGVPVDCNTRQPLPSTYTNPMQNCPERRFEVMYGRYCDFRIVNLRFHAIKIQHAYGGSGFEAGMGLVDAFDINDNGTVVGQAINSSGEKHAVQINIGPFYSTDHYFSDLGVPGLTSTATAISNEHTVAGASQAVLGAASSVDAIWHSQLGGFNVTNALGGPMGAATDLARNSMYTEYMTGYGIWPIAQGGDNGEHGFVWSFDGRNRSVQVIGEPGRTNRALAINDSAIAVGTANDSGSKNAFQWSWGTLSLLPDFGRYASSALDINNNVNPKIVGFAFNSLGKKRAVVWQGATFSVLADLPARNASMATAITDGGDIVGQSGSQAVLWRDGNIYDLNSLLDATLPTTLNKAIDMNRHGQILAKGADGAFYLLLPTNP